MLDWRDHSANTCHPVCKRERVTMQVTCDEGYLVKGTDEKKSKVTCDIDEEAWKVELRNFAYISRLEISSENDSFMLF